MAGSKRWFRYVDDGGTSYSVNLDESNSEGTVAGVRMMPSREAAYPLLPKGFKMRYIYATLVADSNVKRKFYLGNQAAVIAAKSADKTIIAPSYPGSTVVTWAAGSYIGEKAREAPGLSVATLDTGLDDADQGRDQA